MSLSWAAGRCFVSLSLTFCWKCDLSHLAGNNETVKEMVTLFSTRGLFGSAPFTEPLGQATDIFFFSTCIIGFILCMMFSHILAWLCNSKAYYIIQDGLLCCCTNWINAVKLDCGLLQNLIGSGAAAFIANLILSRTCLSIDPLGGIVVVVVWGIGGWGWGGRGGYIIQLL